MKLKLLLVVLCAAGLAAVAHSATGAVASATGLNPDALRLLFDSNAVLIMFVWGMVQKYVPAVASWPNGAIPWINFAGYVLTRLAGQALGVTDAHADVAGAVASLPNAVGVIVGGFTSAVWARQLFEGFGRPLLEQWLGLRKAVPKGRAF